MQKKIWFLILSFITIGCTEKVYVMGPTITKTITKTDTIVIRPTTGQTVNLVVDWSKLSQSSIMSGLNEGNLVASTVDIDQVGSRLVYVNEDAAFTQAVNKTGSTQPQLITLQVPPTDNADLYVVATGRECPTCIRRFAVKLGVKRGIKIKKDTLITLTLDSLSLISANWVIDSTETNYSISNDTIFATRVISNGYTRLKIRVNDPYQVGTPIPNIQTMFVGFYGTGQVGSNPNGMRLFQIDLNPVTKFWPIINGPMFGLSYDALIGKEGVVITNFVNP